MKMAGLLEHGVKGRKCCKILGSMLLSGQGIMPWRFAAGYRGCDIAYHLKLGSKPAPDSIRIVQIGHSNWGRPHVDPFLPPPKARTNVRLHKSSFSDFLVTVATCDPA